MTLPRRVARLVGVLGVSVALVCGAFAGAAATAAPIGHPDQDWAGSQIARHEGHAGTRSVPAANGYVPGLDVSSYQGTVNWPSVAAKGAKFAYIKATEGTSYVNPYFAQQWAGCRAAGLVCGAYHFALPDTAGGKAQADFFVAHGGTWTPDGRTLPPLLDIEYNPYGSTCYGLSQSAMAAWIGAFTTEVHAKTTRWPVIYTSAAWWAMCVGSTGHFAGNDPLFIANYAATPGPLPINWTTWTFWQYGDSGTFPGDQDYFNGTEAQLIAFAKA